MNYKVAMQVVNYIQNCKDRSIFHGIQNGKGLTPFEAFYKLEAATYLKMVLNNSNSKV